MYDHNLKVDSIISTKKGNAKIRKIGPLSPGINSNGFRWAMLTLDINGELFFCVAREDEIDNG